MKTPKLFGKASLLSVVMTAAAVFLAVVLVRDAVLRFSAGEVFSGCVSALGVFLIIVAAVMVALDLGHKSKEKKTKKQS